MANKLHLGPGPNWVKPNPDWLSLDVDPSRADILVNFNNFTGLDFKDEEVDCIYGSHVFEHINIFNAPKVFKECYRILKKGGYFRLVLPDVKKSIEEYIKGNFNFSLFQRRAESLKKLLGVENVSIFECLKGDFISPSSQFDIFGKESLAHQNAWDFEAIVFDLNRAGFEVDKIKKMKFQDSNCEDFSFEGTYPSEANEYDRSIYVEVYK